jgi:hypothetical protein
MAQPAPGETEKFKVQNDDGQVIEVTGMVLARERKPEQTTKVDSGQPSQPAE